MAGSRKHFDTAVDWMVRLRSGEATVDDHAQLQAWIDADSAHLTAWQRVSGTLDASFAPIRQAAQQTLAQRALLDPPSSRRRHVLRGTLAVAAVGVGGGLMATRHDAFAPWTADYRSGIGERRRIRLPDDSELVLNANSAVDLAFSASQRRIRLLRGELLVQVAADATRPLVVETAQGQVQALGTRFTVRQGEGRSHVAVLEHRVAVHAIGGEQVVLGEGEALSFDALRVGAPEPAGGRGAWIDGMLMVRDEPLGVVIDAVRAYRRGVIRVSPAAAQLRVFGALPLDDTDALLESLAQTQPICVASHAGGWWTVIDTRD